MTFCLEVQFPNYYLEKKIRFVFIFSFVRMVCIFLHLHRHRYVWICSQMFCVDIGSCPKSFFHPIYWGCISRSNTELTVGRYCTLNRSVGTQKDVASKHPFFLSLFLLPCSLLSSPFFFTKHFFSSFYFERSLATCFSSLPGFDLANTKTQHKDSLYDLMQTLAAISSRGLAEGQSFPKALTGEKWNALLTSQPQLLGMFCIPLPGSGEVASSKGRTIASKRENSL